MSRFFYMCLRIDRGGPAFVRLVRADHVNAVLCCRFVKHKLVFRLLACSVDLRKAHSDLVIWADELKKRTLQGHMLQASVFKRNL